MSHVRQQLRERAVTTLTGLTTTGSNVHDTRVFPLATSGLPCLAVYAKAESVEAGTLEPPRTMLRELELVVRGVARATSQVEDTLDTIAAEVEAALYADRTLNGLAKDSSLVAVEMELDTDGDNPIGSIELTYAVSYTTSEDDAETAT